MCAKLPVRGDCHFLTKMKALILIALLLSLVAKAQLPIPEPNWDHVDSPIYSSKKEQWSGLNVHPSVRVRLAQGVSEMVK